MFKDTPDHHDAELVLRVYELRREPVMRQSRGTETATGQRMFDVFTTRVKAKLESR